MFRFNLCLCVAAIAIVLAAVLPAQALTLFTEDFEAFGADLAAIGFTGPHPGFQNAIPVNDPGANLGTRVAGLSAGNAHWLKSLGGSGLEDLTEFSFETYATGINAGEALVGIRKTYANPAGAGECASIQACGVFVGMQAGFWVNDWTGLGGNKEPITTGGSPGAGVEFVGGLNQPVLVEVDISKTGGANGFGFIRVDILNRTTLVSLNPTWTVALTAATQTARIDDITQIAVQFADVFTPLDGFVEFDNIRVKSSILPTHSWANALGGDWNTGTNWSPTSIPNSATEIVGFGDANGAVAPLTVTNDLAVTVVAMLFGDDNATLGQQSYTITGTGNVTFAGDVNNTPVIVVAEGSHTFEGTGTIELSKPTGISVGGGSSLALNKVVNLNGNTLTKDGGGTMSINGTIDTGVVGSVVVEGGVVNGTGTVDGDLKNTGGTVAPGLSPGKLTVTGAYLQTGGLLEIEIDGTTAESEYDVLDVTGALTISGGSLDVLLGFTPAAGNVFDILNFGSINLTGATVNLATLPLDLAWDDTQLTVDGTLSVVSIVPTLEWNVDASGDWNSASNWTPTIGAGTVPNSNLEHAVFGSVITSSHTVFTDGAVTVKHITFDNNDTYAIAGTGSVTLDSDNNTSTVSVLQGDHQFQVVVNLSNATTVDTAASTSLAFNNVLNLGGNTLTKTGAGTMNINNILNTGGGAVVASAGVLGGSGTVGGDLTNNGGTVAPGNSAGTLTVAGNYSQTAGKLAIEIDGNAAGEFDVLAVTGNLTVSGGDLDVAFAALPGKFEILDVTGSSSVAFDTISNTGGLNVLFDDSLLDSTGELIVNSAELGDMNGDLLVNTADAALFVQALVDQASYDANGFFVVSADFNGDVDGSGNFDLGDLSAFSALLGGPASASAVPEPSSILLLSLALCGVVLKRRNRP